MLPTKIIQIQKDTIRRKAITAAIGVRHALIHGRLARALDRITPSIDLYRPVGRDGVETPASVYAGKAGRRAFVLGILLCGLLLMIVALVATLAEIFGGDTRFYVALLPLLYVPMLLTGVGWLVWASDPTRRLR